MSEPQVIECSWLPGRETMGRGRVQISFAFSKNVSASFAKVSVPAAEAAAAMRKLAYACDIPPSLLLGNDSEASTTGIIHHGSNPLDG